MLKKLAYTALGGLLVAMPVWSQAQTAKLTAADGMLSDRFGYSVSVSRDTAIAGAFSDDTVDVDTGSAYIFERIQDDSGNWEQVAKLTIDGAAAWDHFGYSVSISGDTAIVGAFATDEVINASGSAYIFERNEGGPGNWGQVAKLTAADADFGDRFGISVAIDGDTAIIGADFDDDGGSATGSAYIFERDLAGIGTWTQAAKLTAGDAGTSDFFGTSVSISGDTVLISSFNDEMGADAGAAYIFERDQGGLGNWGQVVKLTAADAAAADYFGGSVSISGDVAIVGASYDDDGGPESGSAYIFERNQDGVGTWGQVAKLTAFDPAQSDHFGRSVAVDGDAVVVGSQADDDGGTNSGSAYLFERGQGGTANWGLVAKLTATDTSSNDRFGTAVSIDDGTILIGADRDEAETGSAYIFRQGLVCPCAESNELFQDFVEGSLNILTVLECRDTPDMAGLLYVLTNGTTVGAASGTRLNSLSQCGTINLVTGATDFIPVTPEEDEVCRKLLRVACPL